MIKVFLVINLITCILGIGDCGMEKLLIWPELVDGSGGEGLGCSGCRCCGGGGGGGLICSSTELLKVEGTAAATAALTLPSLTWEKLEYVDALRNFAC